MLIVACGEIHLFVLLLPDQGFSGLHFVFSHQQTSDFRVTGFVTESFC